MNAKVKLLRRLKVIAGLQSDRFWKVGWYCFVLWMEFIKCIGDPHRVSEFADLSAGHSYNVASVANVVASAAACHSAKVIAGAP